MKTCSLLQVTFLVPGCANEDRSCFQPPEGDIWVYHTDLSVADRTQSLKVPQGALSSSAVNRPDVIHLPELTFCWVCYNFIQLQEKGKIMETLDTFLQTEQ